MRYLNTTLAAVAAAASDHPRHVLAKVNLGLTKDMSPWDFRRQFVERIEIRQMGSLSYNPEFAKAVSFSLQAGSDDWNFPTWKRLTGNVGHGRKTSVLSSTRSRHKGGRDASTHDAIMKHKSKY